MMARRTMWNSKLFLVIVVFSWTTTETQAETCWNLNHTSCWYHPEAILNGPTFQLGDYQQCLQLIQGKYCLLHIKISEGHHHSQLWDKIRIHSEQQTHFRRDLLHIGVCVPASSTAAEISQDLQEDLEEKALDLGISVEINLNSQDCHVADETTKAWDIVDIIVGCLLLLLIAVIISSSLMECVIRYCNGKVGKKQEVFLTFSVLTNMHKLLNGFGDADGEIKHIHGMRVILVSLVILGHVYSITIQGPIGNLEAIEEGYDNILFTPMVSGSVIICTFFVISGYIFCYKFNGNFCSKKEPMTVTAIVKIIGKRYIRLTPPLLVMIALMSTVVRHIGEGPLWKQWVIQEAESCRDNWWKILLYIGNLPVTSEAHKCVIHSWYVCAEMQLFLINLLILICIYHWQHATRLIFGISLVLACLLPAFITYYLGLDPAFIQIPEVLKHLLVDRTVRYAYAPGYMNIGPYIVGSIGGYLYYTHKKENKKIKNNLSIICWVAGFSISMCTLFSMYPFYQQWYHYNVIISAVYAGLYKSIFSIGTAILLFLGSTGHDLITAIFTSVLGWKPFHFLSRVSYCAFLVHFSLITIDAGFQQHQLYFSWFNLVSNWAKYIVQSFVFGTALSLMVEIPTQNILTMVLGSKREQRKKNAPMATEHDEQQISYL